MSEPFEPQDLKRRHKGTGSVYQRSDNGIWVALADLGMDRHGKRHRRYVYAPTREEAMQKLGRLTRISVIMAPPTVENLGDLRARILRVICDHFAAHGSPPTLDEIRQATETKSNSTIRYHICKLIASGHLMRSNRFGAHRIVIPSSLEVVTTEGGAA